MPWDKLSMKEKSAFIKVAVKNNINNLQDIKKSFDDWYKTVPENRNDTTNYNLRRAFELAPKEELENWRNSSLQDLEEGKNHLRTVYENPHTGNYEFMKSKYHPTLDKELEWFNSNTEDALNFRNNYQLDTSGTFYKYIKKDK